MQKDIVKHNMPIASVIGLCETLSNDPDACPSSTEAQSLQRAKESLEQRWQNINSLASKRKLLWVWFLKLDKRPKNEFEYH